MGIRRAISGAAVAVCALVMNGCVVFQSAPTVAQQGVIGAVRVTVKACASQSSSPPPGACTSDGNSGENATTSQAQVYVAFRVPKGAVAPGSFSSSQTGPTDSGPQLVFSPSPTYTSELQRLQPAPANEQWVGYISQLVSYSSSGGEQNFTASADFGLPKGANGAPFTGPFTYQAVVGGREFFSSPDAAEPVSCQTKLTDGGDTSPEDWICVDDQSPSTLGSDASIATRDAGVEPGAPVKAKPGSSASVPFTFAYAGSMPGGTFTFSPGTSLPGATLTPSPLTASATTTSNVPVGVRVAVPKSAKPGTYSVTLTARSSAGEIRTGTATLTVPGCKVPHLKGHKLSKARKLLKGAGCQLGKVHGHGKKVSGQSPAAGKTFAFGHKVNVTL